MDDRYLGQTDRDTLILTQVYLSNASEVSNVVGVL